ncbi:ABC transporter permease [Paucibacter sp. B51]|uniref:ABC transporter permease n=1 Tax=Paucibacter sp. B51 TaxID=2993315 RepID=UPI0022EBAB14|nr:ABC transporter permease [Paucibacter sp. B51]
MTALGVVIAVAGLMALAATMAGLEAGVNRAFKQIGSDLHQVGPNYRKVMAGKTVSALDDAQWRVLQTQPGLRWPVATMAVSAELQNRQGRPLVLQVKGVQGSWLQLYRQSLSEGRFILPSDVEAHQRVAVLSRPAAAALQLSAPWLAQTVVISGRRLRVIGILGDTDVSSEASWRAEVFVPLSLAREMSPKAQELDFAFAVQPAQDPGRVVQGLTQALRQSMQTPAGEESDFRIQSASDLQRTNRTIIAMVSSVLAVVVAISLLVGGIGIMNVMLVAVQERVQEIGLMRALGATQRCIRRQFLCEAGLLSLLGALLGTVIGIALGNSIVLLLPQAEFSLPPLWAVLLSLGTSLLVGLAAGALPAQRAAELDPVLALHQP